MSAASIQVVSTDTLDSAPLVVFTTENERFLFNCGEGTQRLCTEHKVRLQKVERIFFTETTTKTIFGLPGLCLTIADGGKKRVAVHGPVGLRPFWSSTSRFMHRPDLAVSIQDIEAVEVVECRECRIFCMPLKRGSAVTSDVGAVSVSYICETHDKTGKFDVKKAQELDIPRGPLYAKLKNGEDVELPDGRIIRALDVVASSDPGRSAAIVGAVQRGDVSVLRALPAWQRFLEGGMSHGLMDAVVHLSSADVVFNEPEYASWMAEFGPNTNHIFVGSCAGSGVTAFQASAKQTRKLNMLFPQLFPALSIAPSTPVDLDSPALGKRGTPLLKFNLGPKSRHGWSVELDETPLTTTNAELAVDAASYYQSFLSGDEQFSGHNAGRLLGHMQEVIDVCCGYRSDQAVNEDIASRYGLRHSDADLLINNAANSLWFLGTGCAIPSKYRNVTSIYVQLQSGAILLDAGEGTWQQLLRMVDEKQKQKVGGIVSLTARGDLLTEVATGIGIIWISHPHADHHLGLVQVLAERKRVMMKASGDGIFRPVLLIAPYSVLGFVSDYAKIDPFIKDAYIALPNSFLDPEDPNFIVIGGSFDGGVSPSTLGQEHLEAAEGTRPLSGDDIVIRSGENGDDYSKENTQQMSSAEHMMECLTQLNISRIENVKVNHCSQAYGVRVWSKEGWSIVFSGDTRPCESLVNLGKGATILIHEATFDDTKGEEAVQKKHSTVAEAYDVHRRMGTFRLLLTHFSQRYPTIPPLYNYTMDHAATSTMEAAAGEGNASSRALDAIFACDFMSVSFQDMLWAPSTTAVMAAAFPIAVEEEEDELLKAAGENASLSCCCEPTAATATGGAASSCGASLSCRACKLVVRKKKNKGEGILCGVIGDSSRTSSGSSSKKEEGNLMKKQKLK